MAKPIPTRQELAAAERSSPGSRTLPRIAFIGLGRMGQPMTAHLLAAGYPVTGYDPAREAVDQAALLGASTAASPAQATTDADVVLIMAGTSAQVRDVVTGKDGVLATATPTTTVVISSTINPTEARALGELCSARGVKLLDAPVCRGEAGAQAADLLWFVGGDAEAVDTLRPVMQVCGRDIFHLGPIGAGMVGKAMNNLLLWAAVIADNEAVALAAKYGIDTDELIAGLRLSSGMNQYLNLWGTIDRFPWAHKDMKIVSAMADETGLSLPLAGLLRELVKPMMIQTGCADLITP